MKLRAGSSCQRKGTTHRRLLFLGNLSGAGPFPGQASRAGMRVILGRGSPIAQGPSGWPSQSDQSPLT